LVLFGGGEWDEEGSGGGREDAEGWHGGDCTADLSG
jgi:hypothetical protein